MGPWRSRDKKLRDRFRDRFRDRLHKLPDTVVF